MTTSSLSKQLTSRLTARCRNKFTSVSAIPFRKKSINYPPFQLTTSKIQSWAMSWARGNGQCQWEGAMANGQWACVIFLSKPSCVTTSLGFIDTSRVTSVFFDFRLHALSPLRFFLFSNTIIPRTTGRFKTLKMKATAMQCTHIRQNCFQTA